MHLFRFIPGYEDNIVVAGKEPLLLLLLAFLITFALTRLYTRLARLYGWGSGSVGGTHLHHMTIGILIILITGLLAIVSEVESPWIELLAILFGVGAALTLDEFALWFYLRDVYWAQEGRSSIDATVIGALLAGLMLVGLSPFGLEEEAGEPRLIAFAIVAANVVLALATVLKGKLLLGIVSVFVPVLGLIGAIRLAKPHSPWARVAYRRSPNKQARAVERYQDSRVERLQQRFFDLIGGAPSSQTPSASEPQR